MLIRSFSAALLVLALSLFPVRPAQAETTFSDAVIVVSVGTVAGAILGASTLPFYDDSGAHAKNIFYGAAMGAVLGVFLSAYAGVQDAPNSTEAFAPRRPSTISLNEAPELRLLNAPATVARRSSFSAPVVAWSPLARLRF